MTTITSICLTILALAAALCMVRVLRPDSSLADRIVGLDSMLVTLIAAIAVVTARRNDDAFVDLVVVVTLLGFLGTVTVARYIERRGT